MNSCLLKLNKSKKGQWSDVGGCSGCWNCESRKRKCDFSLDFRPFGPLVLDEARRKVVLRSEGYGGYRFGRVPTTPRGRDLFLLAYSSAKSRENG